MISYTKEFVEKWVLESGGGGEIKWLWTNWIDYSHQVAGESHIQCCIPFWHSVIFIVCLSAHICIECWMDGQFYGDTKYDGAPLSRCSSFLRLFDPNRWVNNTNDYTIKEFKEIDHKPAGNGWSCVYIWITCRGHICSIMEFTADLLTRN